MNADGRLVFLVTKADPDLYPHALGGKLCFAGVTYGDALQRIISAAQLRAGRKKTNKNN